MSAGEIEMRGDPVADGEAVIVAGPDLDDLGGDFMADDQRIVGRHPPRLHVLDGQPRAAGDHPRNRFPRPGHGVRYIPEIKRPVGAFQDQRLHVTPPLVPCLLPN